MVKHSGIHGWGVFAARDIPAKELMIVWSQCSRKLTAKQVKMLSARERKRVSYIGGEYILFKPPACYVNHSCNANSRGENGCDRSSRLIRRGEEITVDYIVEKVPGLGFQCNCNSANCRGFLTVAGRM